MSPYYKHIKDSDVIEKYNQGKNIVEIGKELSFTPQGVVYRLKKNKIPIRKATWGLKKYEENGYVYIWEPKNINANKRGYVLEHRKIMGNIVKRRLGRYEYVHHKNGIRNDNRVENLAILLAEKHCGEIKCPYCQKEFFIK